MRWLRQLLIGLGERLGELRILDLADDRLRFGVRDLELRDEPLEKLDLVGRLLAVREREKHGMLEQDPPVVGGELLPARGEFGSGLGEAMLTMSPNSSRAISNSIARTKSIS